MGFLFFGGGGVTNLFVFIATLGLFSVFLYSGVLLVSVFITMCFLL